MKQKPIRMCSGCRTRRPKNALIRVAKEQDGTIKVDRDKRIEGRGAYICKDNASCLKTARKKNTLGHSLHSKVPVEIYEEIEELISK